jgi:peptidoglycan/LPS O-acetylase OafA/YrhL
VGLTATIAALGGCLLLLLVVAILDRRPYRPGKLNLVPLMIILAVVFIVLLKQLVDSLR